MYRSLRGLRKLPRAVIWFACIPEQLPWVGTNEALLSSIPDTVPRTAIVRAYIPDILPRAAIPYKLPRAAIHRDTAHMHTQSTASGGDKARHCARTYKTDCPGRRYSEILYTCMPDILPRAAITILISGGRASISARIFVNRPGWLRAVLQHYQVHRDAASLRDRRAILRKVAFFRRGIDIFTGTLVINYISIVTRPPQTTPAVTLHPSMRDKPARTAIFACVHTGHTTPGGLHACISDKLPRVAITTRVHSGHTAPGGAKPIRHSCMPDTLPRAAMTRVTTILYVTRACCMHALHTAPGCNSARAHTGRTVPGGDNCARTYQTHCPGRR